MVHSRTAQQIANLDISEETQNIRLIVCTAYIQFIQISISPTSDCLSKQKHTYVYLYTFIVYMCLWINYSKFPSYIPGLYSWDCCCCCIHMCRRILMCFPLISTCFLVLFAFYMCVGSIFVVLYARIYICVYSNANTC